MKAPAQFGFQVGRVLAALGEIAEIIGIARTLGEEGVGQIEDLLKIAVPCDKARVGAKHRNAIAHIIEGNAQFGLAIAQLIEKPGILNRDHRLIGEGGQELDFLVGEWIGAASTNGKHANQRVFAQQWQSK